MNPTLRIAGVAVALASGAGTAQAAWGPTSLPVYTGNALSLDAFHCAGRREAKSGFSVIPSTDDSTPATAQGVWPPGFAGAREGQARTYSCVAPTRLDEAEDDGPQYRGYRLLWRCLDDDDARKVVLVWRGEGPNAEAGPYGRAFIEEIARHGKTLVACRP